jgi:hypothetical protein
VPGAPDTTISVTQPSLARPLLPWRCGS